MMKSQLVLILCVPLCVMGAGPVPEIPGKLVNLKVLYKSESRPFPQELWIAVHAETGEVNYTLQLELNNGLMIPGFSVVYFDEKGKEVVTKGYSNCFYQGGVQGYPEWNAAVSTCRGIGGWFGDASDRQHHYHLHPVAWSPGSDIEDLQHTLYTDSELKPTNGICGHAHDDGEDGMDISKDILTSSQVRRQINGDLLIELVIVSDFRLYRSLDSSVERVTQRALAITNSLDQLFQRLDLRVVLVGVVVWSSGDRINVVSSASTLLERFRDYKPQIDMHHDSALLLTGRILDSDVVGLAYVHSMCDVRSSVAITLDRGSRTSTSSVAGTAAHELGHLLNMGHDTGGCQCSQCVMAAVAFTNAPAPSRWSSCSRRSLERGLEDLQLGRCLTNEPLVTLGEPVCGNGIREREEVCDCGSVQECTDPCCNASSCQLVEGAQCRSGLCCDSTTCQYIDYGTTCHDSTGECDITEYCSGESSECPQDVALQDAAPCAQDQGFCFSAQCRTYNQQCQQFFAKNKGDDACYEKNNVVGNAFGNCGYNLTNYHRCDSSNVFCGQLHCESGQFKLSNTEIGAEITIGTYTVFNAQFDRVSCTSFSPRPGEYQNPGLVQDGSKCGSDKLCFGQKCLPVAELKIPECPVGNGGMICSGQLNGICNNLGLCSCLRGFMGQACSETLIPPDNPTTVTSSGAKSGSDNTGAIAGGVTAVVVLAAVAVVVVVVIVAALWVRRRNRHTPTHHPTEKTSAPSRPAISRDSWHTLEHADTSRSTTYTSNNAFSPPTALPIPVTTQAYSVTVTGNDYTDSVCESGAVASAVQVKRPPPRLPMKPASQTSPRPSRPPPPAPARHPPASALSTLPPSSSLVAAAGGTRTQPRPTPPPRPVLRAVAAASASGGAQRLSGRVTGQKPTVPPRKTAALPI